MSGDQNTRTVLSDAFQELAMAIGGMAATCSLPDEAVWDLSRAIDAIHSRVLSKLQHVANPSTSIRDQAEGEQHPAIKHLLSRLEAN